MANQDFDAFYSVDNDELLNRYEPIAQIGKGKYGIVFHCKRNTDSFAVKVVSLFYLYVLF